MTTLTTIQNVTLDGVMQAPGRPDEDRREGFDRGGWATPYSDEVLGETMGTQMAKDSSLLFGRRTYDDFASYWPHQEDNSFTPVLNARQKYVVTNTAEEPLAWQNSTVLRGDAVVSVRHLKAHHDRDLVILGSGQLVRALLPVGLVDEIILAIHPLTLGRGHCFYGDANSAMSLQLTDSVPTTTGVIVATYRVVRKD